MDVDQRRSVEVGRGFRSSKPKDGWEQWWPAPAGGSPGRWKRHRSKRPRPSSRQTSGAPSGWSRPPSRSMRRQGSGRIVLVGSIGGIVGIPFQAFTAPASSPSKDTESRWPMRWRRYNIEVTIVEPGNVKTDFTANRRTVESTPGASDYGTALSKAIGKMAHDEIERRPSGRRRPRRGKGPGGAASAPSNLSGLARRARGTSRQATPAVCHLRKGGQGQPRRVGIHVRPARSAEDDS